MRKGEAEAWTDRQLEMLAREHEVYTEVVWYCPAVRHVDDPDLTPMDMSVDPPICRDCAAESQKRFA